MGDHWILVLVEEAHDAHAFVLFLLLLAGLGGGT